MCERKILLCKKYVDATFCEQRAKRVLRMRYCMSKHITVSDTSIFKGENVFEKSDQISYSCKAGNPLGLQRKYKDKRTFLEPSKVRRSASLQFEDAL